MSSTFEEFAAGEIDALHNGALFLTAGESGQAERLLLKTLTGAFRDTRGRCMETVSARWLEERLVRTFVAPHSLVELSAAPEARHRGGAEVRGGLVGFDSGTLYRAAQTLPPSARAALWLVLLRRWSYADAANAMEINVEDLRALLLYQHALFNAVLQGNGVRNGTDGPFV